MACWGGLLGSAGLLAPHHKGKEGAGWAPGGPPETPAFQQRVEKASPGAGLEPRALEARPGSRVPGHG